MNDLDADRPVPPNLAGLFCVCGGEGKKWVKKNHPHHPHHPGRHHGHHHRHHGHHRQKGSFQMEMDLSCEGGLPPFKRFHHPRHDHHHGPHKHHMRTGYPFGLPKEMWEYFQEQMSNGEFIRNRKPKKDKSKDERVAEIRKRMSWLNLASPPAPKEIEQDAGQQPGTSKE